MKDLTTSSRQVFRDLRDLQKTGLTLPDIIYNYRIEDGRLVRKRYREGSQSGSDREDSEDERELNASKAKAKADADADAAAAAKDTDVKVWRRISKRVDPGKRRDGRGSERMQGEGREGRELDDMVGVGQVGQQSEGVVTGVKRKPVGIAKTEEE